MSKIQRFDVYGSADYKDDGSLVLYDHHKEIVAEKEKEIERLKSNWNDVANFIYAQYASRKTRETLELINIMNDVRLAEAKK